MEKKVYVNGLGRLDAAQLNLMMESAWDYKDQVKPFNAPKWDGPYLAMINPPSGQAPQELAYDDDGYANKWRYDYVVVSPEWNEKDGDRLHDFNSDCYLSTGMEAGGTACALNLWEINNTGNGAMGIDSDNLAGTFKIQPVPTATMSMLWMCPMPYVTDDPSYAGENGFLAVFHYPNQFDGAC